MSFLVPCLLTAAAETAFFAAAGYGKGLFLLLVIFINITTNLTLNLLVGAAAGVVDITYFIYLLEAAVVAVEYLVYALALGRSKRLFLLTLAANVLTYTLGVIIFGHV